MSRMQRLSRSLQFCRLSSEDSEADARQGRRLLLGPPCMRVTVSCIFPRPRGQSDLERLNCEVNLSEEKGQTHDRGEHSRNKESAYSQAIRKVQDGTRKQRRDYEAHEKPRDRAELNCMVDQLPTSFQDA